MESPTYTIDEWCKRRKICRASYYNLKKAGRAPTEMRVGGAVRITAEADDAWRRRMEAESTQRVAA